MHAPQIRVVVKVNYVAIHKENYQQVAAIYREGIATNIATFETEVPDWETWNNKYFTFCRIAIADKSKILVWASLSAVSKREVYKGVAEVSVYVKASERGKGLGEKMLLKLISESEENNIWSLQASIFRQNKASLHIHKKCGFREIGYKEKIAKQNNVWQDNILLERRSSVVI